MTDDGRKKVWIRNSTIKMLKKFDDCTEESFDGKITYLLDLVETMKDRGVWDMVMALIGR